MRLACAKCGYQLESFILDKQTALEDIAKKLNRHLEKEHREMIEPMQKYLALGMQALTMVAPFTEFVMVPEQEEFVNEKLDEGKEIVMTLLGYVASDDEDEEEIDEEAEEEEENDSVIVLPSAPEPGDTPPVVS